MIAYKKIKSNPKPLQHLLYENYFKQFVQNYDHPSVAASLPL